MEPFDFSDAAERREYINSKQVNGGWTHAQLKEWGVPLPAPPMWRITLILYGIPYTRPSLANGDEVSHNATVAKGDRHGRSN